MFRTDIDEILAATGALLRHDISIVVVGGASIIALGLVKRATTDVDVIATADERRTLMPAEPMAPDLQAAIGRVARDFQLSPDWMNTVVSRQFAHGLPPGIEGDIEWRRYDRLNVGFVGRRSLIYLKLFAVVDQDRRSVHYQDLLAMHPSDAELRHAADWVSTQDAAESFRQLVDEVVRHVRKDLGIL